LAFQLLRFAPKLQPPQLGDQQLQMFDFVVARNQLLVFAEELFVLRVDLCMLREDESF
jgi:hypothetical protein